MDTAKIGIFCVGNILLLDEGFGPRIASELNQRYEFSSNVEVLDVGTLGMAMIGDLKRFNVVLLVDALDNTGHPPGTVLSFLPEDMAQTEVFHGAHDTRFADVLAAMSLMGYEIDAHCLGVQIENMSPPEHMIGLTSAVEASIPYFLECVRGFLSKYGVATKTLDHK